MSSSVALPLSYRGPEGVWLSTTWTSFALTVGALILKKCWSFQTFHNQTAKIHNTMIIMINYCAIISLKIIIKKPFKGHRERVMYFLALNKYTQYHNETDTKCQMMILISKLIISFEMIINPWEFKASIDGHTIINNEEMVANMTVDTVCGLMHFFNTNRCRRRYCRFLCRGRLDQLRAWLWRTRRWRRTGD